MLFLYPITVSCQNEVYLKSELYPVETKLPSHNINLYLSLTHSNATYLRDLNYCPLYVMFKSFAMEDGIQNFPK